jgi:hypothetical protein
MEHPLDEGAIQRILGDLFPRLNRFGSLDFTELLTELKAFGIDTPAKLRAVVLKHRREALRIDREPFDALNARLQREELGDARYAHLSRRRIFFNWAGLLRLTLELQFGERYRDFKDRTYHAVPSAV